MLTMAPTTKQATRHIRFIADGLTFDKEVWRAGAVCATTDPLADLTEKEQRARWGIAFYEQISEDEYLVVKDKPAVFVDQRFAPRPSPPPPGVKMAESDAPDVEPIAIARQTLTEIPPAPSIEEALTALASEPGSEPFAWYEKANVSQTLELVASMGELEVAEFLLYERAHKNRTGIVSMIEKGE